MAHLTLSIFFADVISPNEQSTFSEIYGNNQYSKREKENLIILKINAAGAIFFVSQKIYIPQTKTLNLHKIKIKVDIFECFKVASI